VTTNSLQVQFTAQYGTRL